MRDASDDPPTNEDIQTSNSGAPEEDDFVELGSQLQIGTGIKAIMAAKAKAQSKVAVQD